MPPPLLQDPRVRGVVWHDLVPLRLHEILVELLLPLPWLVLSLTLAGWGWYVLALLGSFVFFLTGLRLVHNAYHYALGTPRWVAESVMTTLSALMLGSMHAIQFEHLRHHRHCLDDEDVEGMCARMRWWQALLVGPWFPLKLHLHALSKGNRRVRLWVGAELLANLVWCGLVFLVWDVPVLRYHVTAMAVGQCLTGFFAVWTVHHDCDRVQEVARTLRGWLKNTVSFNMFFHIEHHLFPRVPTCHLSRLASRLDEAVPELQAKQVFPIR